MLRLPTLALLAFGLCSAAAAQDKQPLPNPITHPGATWSFQGFTVRVPDQPGWVSHFKDKHSAALALENPEDERGVTILSDTLKQPVGSAEELVNRLKDGRPTLIDLERYIVEMRDEQPEQVDGYWCSRYALTARDSNAALERPRRMLIRGLTCVDPRNPTLLVDVGYSQIGDRTTTDDDFRVLGERVARSLRFGTADNAEGLAKAKQAYRDRHTADAVAILTPLAESGDLAAAALLGDFLMNPADGPADLPQARRWLTEAAPEGSPQTLYNLGVLYEKGAGGERDIEQALKWFGLAADQRDPSAQLNLGILYHPKGPAAPQKDVQTARQWLLYAANNGNQRARRLLMQEQLAPQP
jgi:hypothetical protein